MVPKKPEIDNSAIASVLLSHVGNDYRISKDRKKPWRKQCFFHLKILASCSAVVLIHLFIMH